MDKIINYDNLRKFCYSNDHLINGEIKGIVLEFVGLGGMTMYNNDLEIGISYAKNNIVYIIPYYNPWSWMNKNTILFVNEIIEVIINHYELMDVKIVSTGKSMGGLCSLVYARYGKINNAKVVKVVANCPVCDLVYHYSERDDLPRTLYSAFFNEEGDIQNALSKYSPIHLVKEMPDIDYVIFHCLEDKAVNIDNHSRKFVNLMNEYNIKLIEVPGRGHCDLSDEALKLFYDEIANIL